MAGVGDNRPAIGSQSEAEGRPVRALAARNGERVLEVLEDVLMPRACDDGPIRGKREINATPDGSAGAVRQLPSSSEVRLARPAVEPVQAATLRSTIEEGRNVRRMQTFDSRAVGGKGIELRTTRQETASGTGDVAA